MSIIKMKKVAVIGLDTTKEKLISDLMEIGVVEITDQSLQLADDKWKLLGSRDGDEDKIAALESQINRVSLALETLERYSIEKSPLFKTRKAMKMEEFSNRLGDQAKIYKNIDYVLSLNDKIHQYKEQINKFNADLGSVTPWVSYDLPLEIEGTKNTFITLGVVPSTVEIQNLISQAETQAAETSIMEVNRDKDLIYVAAITMVQNHEEVLNTMKQLGFSPTPFKGMKGTASEIKENLIEKIQQAQKECLEVETEISTLSEMRHGIECVFDQLTIGRDKEKIKEKLLKTKRTFNLEGWVPVGCEEAIDQIMEQNQCCFAYRDPEEGEEVPVLTVNSSFVQPFEAITNMYSLPAYTGVDPTKYFAIFYAMFFGIMLSDAGYGIVMAIACFIILKKFQLEGMTYRMIKMFFFCGISTIFWGAMFGGWFGDFFQVAARVIFHKEIVINPIWFNPIEDPVPLLIFSLILGVIHIFLGMAIKAKMLISEGKWKDAVFDIFSWYLVILGIAMWLGGGFVSQILVKPGMYMAIVGAAVLLLTGGREKKGFGKIIGGFGAIYNITSYISDILSYARLLALGLATGVIAQVVNLMGSLAGDGIFGIIVLLFAFIVGHTFNLAINTLGAFVHSSRLQYIEFFGKFYEDGGEEFAPFEKNTKYVRLINDTNNTNGGKK
ncbi:MAG: V-type ATP synthase subunit I [Anaerovoracaceae bacterium]